MSSQMTEETDSEEGSLAIQQSMKTNGMRTWTTNIVLYEFHCFLESFCKFLRNAKINVIEFGRPEGHPGWVGKAQIGNKEWYFCWGIVDQSLRDTDRPVMPNVDVNFGQGATNKFDSV